MNSKNSVSETLSDGRPVFVSSKQRIREESLQPKAGDTLLGAMQRAYEAEGLEMPTATEPEKCYGQEERTLTWVHPHFGSVSIQVRDHRVGEAQKGDSNIRAQIHPTVAKPTDIWLETSASLKPSIRMLRAQGKDVTDVTDRLIPTFRVAVSWVGPSQDDPHTRVKDMDNFDLVMIDADGHFVQIQISVSTLGHRFWLASQEVYWGQIVRTRQSIAQQLGAAYILDGSLAVLVLPLYAKNAHPDIHYLSQSFDPAQAVVWYAANNGLVSPLSRAVVARWNPAAVKLSEQDVKKGWQMAVVKFFNVIVHFGYVDCQDGVPCFVHFSRIIDGTTGQSVASKGEFPVLEPMTVVAVKWQEKDGKRQATAVKIIG